MLILSSKFLNDKGLVLLCIPITSNVVLRIHLVAQCIHRIIEH